MSKRPGNETIIWAVWHGGANYSPSSVDEGEELLYGDVVSMALDRFHNRDGWSTPCVDESSEVHVYFADPRNSDDPYPDELVTWSRYHNTYRREAC